MQDSELIASLRSDDPEDRRKALDRLFPHSSVLLLVHTDQSNQSASTTRVDTARLFASLVGLCVQVGGMLGVKLGWMQDPEAEPERKIQIVPGGALD